MKSIKILIVLALTICSGLAQTNPPAFIKGEINIKYNSREGSPTKGVKDIYNININVCNSALFHGTIADTPLIMEGIFTKTPSQNRSLYYDIACDVVNPKNPSQTKNVGRMFGIVPIDPSGAYLYDKGTLEISVLPMGSAGGFNSKFTGIALGKPLVRPANWLDSLKREAVNITRSVNGKTMTMVLKKYDKMEMRNCVLGAGPVQIYQSVIVNGELLYDYDRFSWIFNGVTIQYAIGGTIKVDRLAGTIRWVESPQRKANGQGEYQFDVRVNEPAPSEGAAFAAPTDETSFFETDSSVPAVVGTMKYKDTLRGDTTLASSVAVDLTGNNLNKQQAMAICKLIIFNAVVPMNAD